MYSRGQSAFTLYELMVTLLVAGIVFGLGVPNLLQFTRNNRMSATANDFVTAIHLSRSEAVTQRTPVTLCASPNPVAASPSCSPDASGTHGGFVVWVDADSDAVVDGDEDVLLQSADPTSVTVLGDNGYVHFDREGYVADIASEGNAASLVLFCDNRGNVLAAGGTSAARAVRIPPTGRPQLLTGVDEISGLSISCP